MSDRPAAVTCSHCGQVIAVPRRFCPACGAPLAGPATPARDFYAQLAELRTALAAAFSLGELKDVAFALGIVDFASLPGETKEDKARELIARVVREDRLPQLLALCRRERPQQLWPFAPPAPGPPENPLAEQFGVGVRYQLEGRLADALQVFEGIQRLAPDYPGLAGRLLTVRQELGRGYGRGGVVDPHVVLHPHAGDLPPAGRPLPKAVRGGATLWVIIVIAVLLLLVLAAVWFLLLRS